MKVGVLSNMNNVWRQIVTAVLIAACIGSFTFAATQLKDFNAVIKPLTEHEVKLDELRRDVEQIRSSDASHMDAVTQMLAEQAKQSAAQIKQTESILRLADAQMAVIQALHKTLIERNTKP